MLFGIVEHGGADAVFAVGTFEHIHIDTSLAAAPECFVVGKVCKSHRLIPQLGVHGHHCSTAGEAEYLGMGPSGACQGECHVLDVLRHPPAAEVRVYNESGCGDILLVSPSLNVAESSKLFSLQGNHSLGLFHFCGQILVGTFDTRPPHLCRIGNRLEDGVDILLMRGIGHHHCYFFHCSVS